MELSRSFCPQSPEFLGPIRRCVRIWVTILQHLQLFPLGIWMSGGQPLVRHENASAAFMLSTVWPNIATYCLCGRHISKKIGTCICTYTHNHTYVYTYPCTYKCIHIHIQYIYGYVKSNSLHYIYIQYILSCTVHSTLLQRHMYTYIYSYMALCNKPPSSHCFATWNGTGCQAAMQTQKQSQVASIFS